MTWELTCLVVMTLFFFFAWMPTTAAKVQTWGMGYLLSNRDRTDLPPLPLWGERANRAYENLKSYFPAFIVAVFVLCLERRTDSGIRFAAGTYVVGRVLHFVTYTLGSPLGRAGCWGVAMAANLYLLVRCF